MALALGRDRMVISPSSSEDSYASRTLLSTACCVEKLDVGHAAWRRIVHTFRVSYDLVFWRQHPTEARTPVEILQAIATGPGPTEGLVPLPTESMIARLLEVVPSAERLPNGEGEWIVCDGPDQSWSFQIEWSTTHFWASLRGAWTGATANKLVDVALEFDCPLFDPQTGERFG
ncbi:MAG: hypothetical protein OEU32_14800 [Acidimicrobiia bacterium]|nr:hypothetical protein [Acidimicrobiia bacterium]